MIWSLLRSVCAHGAADIFLFPNEVKAFSQKFIDVSQLTSIVYVIYNYFVFLTGVGLMQSETRNCSMDWRCTCVLNKNSLILFLRRLGSR